MLLCGDRDSPMATLLNSKGAEEISELDLMESNSRPDAQQVFPSHPSPGVMRI